MMCRFNLALAFFVPPAFTNIQWQTYMIFGTFCAAMTVHVFFLYPETAKKSLEEIDLLFEQNVPAWRSSQYGGTFQDRVEDAKQGRLGSVADEKPAPGLGDVTHTHREAV